MGQKCTHGEVPVPSPGGITISQLRSPTTITAKGLRNLVDHSSKESDEYSQENTPPPMTSMMVTGLHHSELHPEEDTPKAVGALGAVNHPASILIKQGDMLSPDKAFMNVKFDSDALKQQDAQLKRNESTDSAFTQELDKLKRNARSQEWHISSTEVTFQDCFSTTLKSAVYLADWRGTKVVAKTVKRGMLSSQQRGAHEDFDQKLALEEMLHEVRILSTLRHPDLVLFLGACLDTQPCFFITEYMEGGDLMAHMMKKAQKLGHAYKPPMSQVIRWAASCSRALCFLHECGKPIIHRDLKPLNLLLSRTLDLKVTDFGLSKIMAPVFNGTDSNPAPKMSGGVGTYRYMAPEVVRYEQYTDRIDIYSFGLIVYFMCTGKQPFYEICGADPEKVLKMYLQGLEPRPTLSNSVGTADLRKLMEDCWHVTPACRPSARSCSERLAVLATLLDAKQDGKCSVQ